MKIEVKSFKDLKSLKKSKNAIFLGCGPSINHLDDEDIHYIHENLDIWTSNCFLINEKIVPDFYHMEIKHHRNGPLVSRLSPKRSTMYKNTAWIIDQTRGYILNYVSPKDYDSSNFYIYPKHYRKEENGKYVPHAEYVSVSANASLTVISDLMLRMNYETIYFLGVDMIDSTYFWTMNNDYDHVQIEDIIKTCKAESVPSTEMHPTNHMKDWIPEFFNHNNQKIINLSKLSLFKENIKTMNIKEVIENEV